MKKRFILFVISIVSTAASAQWINTVTVPANILECNPFTVAVTGDLPGSNWSFVNSTTSLNGSFLIIQMNFNSTGFGSPTITPFSQNVTIPANTAPAGNYTLRVEAYSLVTGQMTNANNQPVTIGSCCPVAANFTLSATELCWNDTLFITDQSSGSTNIEWYVNGSLDHTGAGDFSLTGLSGTVNIAQYAIDPSCTDSSAQTVTVSPAPPAGFTALQNGNAFTFTAQGGSAFDYSWDFGDGNTATGSLATHSYTQDGVYNVCLTSTDDDNCSADSCIGVNYSTVGLTERANELRIFPNPATDYLTVEGAVDAPIRWYNELGQEVRVPLHNGSQEFVRIFDLQELPAGIYYLQWADQADKVIIQ